MQVWALLLPASTRLSTVLSSILAGAVIVGNQVDTIAAQSKGTAEADSAIPGSAGEYSHSQTPTLTLVAVHCTAPVEKTNHKRIGISKALPKTRICIKYSKLFLNNLVGVLNVCGLENILGSSVREKSNGITFATFWREAC